MIFYFETKIDFRRNNNGYKIIFYSKETLIKPSHSSVLSLVALNKRNRMSYNPLLILKLKYPFKKKGLAGCVNIVRNKLGFAWR